MARIFQLTATPGSMIDPLDQLAVDHAGDVAHRATQVQVMRGLLQQTHDPAIVYPVGSFGAAFLSGAGGALGSIDNFVSTPGPVVELGSSVVNPVLNWSLSSMTVISQTLTGALTGAVVLTSAQRSVNLTGTLISDTTWGLTVNNTSGVVSANATLAFGHYVHYGRGPVTTLNAAAILALTGGRLAVAASGQYNYSAGTDPNAYLWFCYPDSWGTLTFMDVLSELPLAMFDAGTVSVTNASGHTRAFRCMRSLNALHSAMSVGVL